MILKRLPGEFQEPVHVADSGDGSGRLFVVEAAGVIKIIQNGQVLPTPFLDIQDRVKTGSTCGECGLLSIAFPPNFATQHDFFVYYNSRQDLVRPDNPNEPNDGADSVIARFHVTGDPNVADPGSEERILVVNQPYENHNGGQLAFGPDGYLYIGLGDGGAGGDPLNNGQRTNTLLGKILRVAVSDSGTSYTIPADNPFAHTKGNRPEIWAYGLRNPWRFSFDPFTHDLYIGDVGQDNYEEIDVQPSESHGGENYGWHVMEGFHCYRSTSCDSSGLVLPVVEYNHDKGDCAVIGGMVYRSFYAGQTGVYLYGDNCSGLIRGLRHDSNGWESQQLLASDLNITSFGQDSAGHVYLASLNGGVYQVTDRNQTPPYSLFLPRIER